MGDVPTPWSGRSVGIDDALGFRAVVGIPGEASITQFAGPKHLHGHTITGYDAPTSCRRGSYLFDRTDHLMPRYMGKGDRDHPGVYLVIRPTQSARIDPENAGVVSDGRQG
jgi:hypothetical protein